MTDDATHLFIGSRNLTRASRANREFVAGVESTISNSNTQAYIEWFRSLWDEGKEIELQTSVLTHRLPQRQTLRRPAAPVRDGVDASTDGRSGSAIYRRLRASPVVVVVEFVQEAPDLSKIRGLLEGGPEPAVACSRLRD